MYTYQKVKIGLVVLSFALPLLGAAIGFFGPLGDPIGGVGPG